MPDPAATPSSAPETQPEPGANRIILVGELVEMSAMRRTPTGVPVLGMRLHHRSRQIENGLPREVECELEALAIGSVAEMVKAAGMAHKVRLEGFLAQKSLRNLKPVLHVEKIEFLEGQ